MISLTVETPQIIDPMMEDVWVVNHMVETPQIVDPMMRVVRIINLSMKTSQIINPMIENMLITKKLVKALFNSTKQVNN